MSEQKYILKISGQEIEPLTSFDYQQIEDIMPNWEALAQMGLSWSEIEQRLSSGLKNKIPDHDKIPNQRIAEFMLAVSAYAENTGLSIDSLLKQMSEALNNGSDLIRIRNDLTVRSASMLIAAIESVTNESIASAQTIVQMFLGLPIKEVEENILKLHNGDRVVAKWRELR